MNNTASVIFSTEIFPSQNLLQPHPPLLFITAPRLSLGGTTVAMPTGLSSTDICSAIDVLTQKSQSCQGPANQINIVNIALAVSGFGPIPVR